MPEHWKHCKNQCFGPTLSRKTCKLRRFWRKKCKNTEKIKGPDNPTWEVNDVPFVWRSVSSHTALIFTATQRAAADRERPGVQRVCWLPLSAAPATQRAATESPSTAPATQRAAADRERPGVQQVCWLPLTAAPATQRAATESPSTAPATQRAATESPSTAPATERAAADRERPAVQRVCWLSLSAAPATLRAPTSTQTGSNKYCAGQEGLISQPGHRSCRHLLASPPRNWSCNCDLRFRDPDRVSELCEFREWVE